MESPSATKLTSWHLADTAVYHLFGVVFWDKQLHQIWSIYQWTSTLCFFSYEIYLLNTVDYWYIPETVSHFKQYVKSKLWYIP